MCQNKTLFHLTMFISLFNKLNLTLCFIISGFKIWFLVNNQSGQDLNLGKFNKWLSNLSMQKIYLGIYVCFLGLPQKQTNKQKSTIRQVIENRNLCYHSFGGKHLKLRSWKGLVLCIGPRKKSFLPLLSSWWLPGMPGILCLVDASLNPCLCVQRVFYSSVFCIFLHMVISSLSLLDPKLPHLIRYQSLGQGLP